MANTYNEAGFTYNDVGSTYNGLGAASAPWPTGPIVLRADLQLNGVWTNVTSDVYTPEKVTITRGRQDEAAAAQASSCAFTLNNRTGKYTPRNPAGIYYGQFGRNTPVRIGIGVPPAGTATGGQAASTNIVAPAVTAEASGVVLHMWAQQANTAVLTAPGTAAAQQQGASILGLTSVTSWAAVSGSGTVAASTATSTVSAVSAAASIFIPGAAAPGGAAQLANGQYSFSSSAFGPTAATGTISVSAGDVLVALVAWASDSRNAMICAPIDQSQSVEWTLVSDSGPSSGPRVQAWARYCPVAASFQVQAPGECYGGNDTQLAVYQLTGAAAWNPRYTGACSDLSSTADLSGNDVRTPVVAGQILRQRGQGQQANKSAAYRYLLARSPLAYWPLETGTQGGVFNSPIGGVTPAVPFAVTSGADSTSFICSDALPQTQANGSIQMFPPNYAATTNTAGTLFFLMNITAAANNPSTIFAIKLKHDGTSASISAIEIQYVSGTDFRFVRIDGTGTALSPGAISVPTTAGALTGGSVIGLPVGVFVNWAPNAGAPSTQADFRVTLVTTNGVVGDHLYSAQTGTIGQVLSLGANLDPNVSVTAGVPVTYGHVMFDNQANTPGASPTGSGVIGQSRVFPNVNCYKLVTAFTSESISLRLRRLCQDESIFLSTPILASETADLNNVRHGPQPISNGLSLIQLTQVTDGGELAEARGFNGLLYRALGSLGSRPVVTTLDYNAKQITAPFAPADDDQLIRNDVTVTQQSGSSAHVVATTGTLNSMPPPTGVGTYTSSITVDVAQQGRDLQQIAQWLLALGTYDAQRFKAVLSQLEASPTTATAVSLIDIGNHIQINNTPNWVQPGPSDLIVLGMTEVIGTMAEWEITFSGRPYGQFNVLRMDSTQPFGLLDSGSSTLTTGVASGVTSLSITTSNANDLWGTGNPPFDIILSGERMTVTAITGTTSPQTFTVTRSVNGVVKAQTAGTAVDVFYKTYLGLNAGS